MKELFVDAILPLLVVTGFVLGSTALLFDVPPEPSQPPEAAQAPAPSGAAPASVGGPSTLAPTSPSPTGARGPVRETANEVMARAMATLGAAAGGEAPRGLASGAAAEPVPARGDPETVSAMSAISAAVRAAREARTEADLLRAEDAVREARRRMDAACAATGGPLCQSAREMQRLGF